MPVYAEKELVDGQKRWYVRTYMKDKYGHKKQVTKHNKTWIGREGKKEAERYENSLGVKLISNKNITFTLLKDKFLESVRQDVKEATYVSYLEAIKNQIEPFFEKCGNVPITYDLIYNWHEEMLKKDISIAYMNKCNAVMTRLLQIGVKYFDLERNFNKDIGCFKQNKNEIDITEEKVRYITLEQFKIFISSVKEELWYTVFYTLYYTGLRKGELIALTWEDIDFNRNLIKINKTYTDRTQDGVYKIVPSTKNYKTRNVEINNSLKNVLLAWYEREKQREDFSTKDFVFGGKWPLSTTTMTNKKNQYFKVCGLEPITIHEFRHSHVSLLVNEYIKNGLNDSTKFFLMMSDRMGHTIQVMQETYMHLFPDVQRELVNLLNVLG